MILVLALAAGLQVPLGDSLLARGRWNEASAAYRRGLANVDSLRARVGEARILELRGRRDEARRGYAGVLSVARRMTGFTATDLLAVGMAAERLSAWEPDATRQALRFYDLAANRAPMDPEPRLRAASLLLSRYNGAEASRGFAEVRRRWPGNARAVLGQAEVRRFFADGDPVALADTSLALDSMLVEAHVFRARMALETEDYDGALRGVARALAINQKSREALAVRAAIALLRGDSAAFAAVDRAITADDPRAGDHLVAAAEAAARGRRYAEAVRLASLAVSRDSAAWRGWALLGVNRMRIADIGGGRAALEIALRGDPYDLWTKNTLDLLDTLQRWPVTASPRFRFVMDGRESALLTPYFAPVAEDAYEKLAARYGVRPATPIRVEVFSRHADFSVRTVGLAGIGALGVCFGGVIVMDSPSARDRGQFNWGSTLWHEIAHTFHLALSDHRVPRWLTEGLAVLEERRARPGWGAEPGPEFLLAWSRDSLPRLSRLNDGFVRPRSGIMLGHAYVLASLAAEWLESVHGADVSRRMLEAYGRGRDTPAVLREVLRAEPESLDVRFEAWMRARYAPALADLGRYAQSLANQDDASYDERIRLANRYESLGRPDAALEELERALYVSPLDPALHERLAGHYTRLRRHEDLVREREAVVALRPTDRAGAWFRLAQAHALAGQRDAARRAVLRALEVAPGYADAQDLLLRLTEERP